MKKLLLLLLFSGSVLAEGQVYDPAVTDILHVTCEYPIEREDGSILLLQEIGSVEFYVSSDGNWGTPHSTNVIDCETFIDMTQLSNGQYYVSATATDTGARRSAFSVDPIQSTIGSIPFYVQRAILPPKAPSNLVGSGLGTL